MDPFLERLIPLCRSFLFSVFLAEFPSGAWVPSKSTYLPWFSSPREKEPKEGHLPIFKWHWWPNVDGANSLSWNFIDIPVNQVIQPLFLSYYFLAEFPSGAWVPTKPINFAWASKIGPRRGPQCLLSFRRTGRHLQPT